MGWGPALYGHESRVTWCNRHFGGWGKGNGFEFDPKPVILEVQSPVQVRKSIGPENQVYANKIVDDE